MSVEGVVLVSVVVLGFSIALAFLARALGKNAETLRDVIEYQSVAVGVTTKKLADLCSDASDKAHALSDEYREMYAAKVEASKGHDDDGLVKLSDDEKAIIAHYRNNQQMQQAIANPPPNPADDLLNPQ